MDLKIRRTIATIPDQAWVGIRYPQAIWDDDEQRWISDAEVAAVDYTAFASRRKQAVTAELIVRRVRRLAPEVTAGQTELGPAWRYHAVFTDSPFPTLQAEADHRHHAIIEQLNAELIDGPLAHLPSGVFTANAAWLSCAGIAHKPAARRGRAGLPLPRHRPLRHPAPTPDRRPGPDRAPRPRPDHPAPARALALVRRLGRAVQRHPPNHPPRTTGPRGLTGPGPGPAPRRPTRSIPKITPNRIGPAAEPSAADTACPHPTETITIQEDDHLRFVGGSGLS